MFLTQEIGSIQRPIWRQKLDAPANPEWIASAAAWAQRCNVAEGDELAALLKKDGAKRTPEEKQRMVEIASLYVLRMFESVGLDRVFNGEQPRTEMYDFLASNTDGIQPAGVLNSFDANYFKKGVIAGPLHVKPEAVDFFSSEYRFVADHTNRVVKPCLTGPYTMTDWSYVEHHRVLHEKNGKIGADALRLGRHDAALDFAKNVLNPIVRDLAKNGAHVIQIDEPAAATREDESALFAQCVNAAFDGVPSGVEKAVHLCYSNYSSLFPELADCVADSYLIEFTNHASPTAFRPDQVNSESFRAIELFNEYGMPVNVGVGVVDIHSDLIESPDVIKDRLLYAAKLVGDPKRVQANPDCGLRTRQWDVAYAKLENLVKGAALARSQWGA